MGKADLPEVWNESDPSWNAQSLEAAAIADNIQVEQYKNDMVAQCREMDAAIEILQAVGNCEKPMVDYPPEVDESGVFHDLVRPILEREANHCSSYHGSALTWPQAGLSLGWLTPRVVSTAPTRAIRLPCRPLGAA